MLIEELCCYVYLVNFTRGAAADGRGRHLAPKLLHNTYKMTLHNTKNLRRMKKLHVLTKITITQYNDKKK